MYKQFDSGIDNINLLAYCLLWCKDFEIRHLNYEDSEIKHLNDEDSELKHLNDEDSEWKHFQGLI